LKQIEKYEIPAVLLDYSDKATIIIKVVVAIQSVIIVVEEQQAPRG
jgi:hypothetical protein